VAVSLGSLLSVGISDRSTKPRPFEALAAGLHTSPATVAHDGSQHVVSIELTPLGTRALLGVPAAELAGTVVELDGLLGGDARELVNRLAAATSWRARFAVIDDILTRRAHRRDVCEESVDRAWHELVASGGTLRIGELARETGYSRRQLTKRFTGEYGLTPKQASRIMRFERSWHLLRHLERRRRASPHRERRSLPRLPSAAAISTSPTSRVERPRRLSALGLARRRRAPIRPRRGSRRPVAWPT
jgi:AraC-like DNA-binding protein